VFSFSKAALQKGDSIFYTELKSQEISWHEVRNRRVQSWTLLKFAFTTLSSLSLKESSDVATDRKSFRQGNVRI
jgi:hypothetical protein